MKPIIFCFAIEVRPFDRQSFWNPSDRIAIAMHENGEMISSHYCSSVEWAKIDITGKPHTEKYRKIYPSGYELRWVDSIPDNWVGE